MPKAVRVRPDNGSLGQRSTTVKLPPSFYKELERVAALPKAGVNYKPVSEVSREAVMECHRHGMAVHRMVDFLTDAIGVRLGRHILKRIIEEETKKGRKKDGIDGLAKARCRQAGGYVG